MLVIHSSVSDRLGISVQSAKEWKQSEQGCERNRDTIRVQEGENVRIEGKCCKTGRTYGWLQDDRDRPVSPNIILHGFDNGNA